MLMKTNYLFIYSIFLLISVTLIQGEEISSVDQAMEYSDGVSAQSGNNSYITINNNYILSSDSDNETVVEEHLEIEPKIEHTNEISIQALIDNNRKVAWGYAKKGNHVQAIKIYKSALDIKSDDWKTLHGYGWSLYKLGRILNAEEALGKSVASGKESEGIDTTWTIRGLNFKAGGDFSEAKKCFSKAIQINSNNIEAKQELKKLNSGGIENSSRLYIVIAKPKLKVRAKPSTKGKQIGSLLTGSKINIIKFQGKQTILNKKRGRWAKIRFNNKYGYVFGAYLIKI